ncbi:MAG TPA: hypothetical protein VGD52_08920 [Pseudoduganella sp.]
MHMPAPKSSTAYAAAQNALQPVAESLQVDDSLISLAEVLEFNVETVHALLRRLEPVTGEVLVGDPGFVSGIAKVPLALRIDAARDALAILTNEVQATIRALQI